MELVDHPTCYNYDSNRSDGKPMPMFMCMSILMGCTTFHYPNVMNWLPAKGFLDVRNPYPWS